MTITRATQGQPIELYAGDWNQIRAAVAFVQRLQRSGMGVLGASTPASVIVQARNETSEALSSGYVASLNVAVPATPGIAFLEEPAFTLKTVTAADPVAIALDPIAVNASGRVILAGLAVCQITVSNAAHGYAGPVANTPAGLISVPGGPVRILHKSAATGTVTAVVMLATGLPMPADATKDYMLTVDGAAGTIQWRETTGDCQQAGT
jgi:hypothetical protein